MLSSLGRVGLDGSGDVRGVLAMEECGEEGICALCCERNAHGFARSFTVCTLRSVGSVMTEGVLLAQMLLR